MWDWVGVEGSDCVYVGAVDGCDWVGSVEAADGCSVVVGVCSKLCGMVAIVVGWELGSVAAAYFEGFGEKCFYVSALEVVEALVDSGGDGFIVAVVRFCWAKDKEF